MTKILIVEDEEVIRKGIRTILDRAFPNKIVFLEAGDGLEALVVYQEELPSIIISDVKMPDCDGLEMIERINQQTSKPPEFLVISGYNEFAYAKQAIQLGVLDYLLKPVDKNELINTVKMLLDRNENVQNESKKQLRDSIKLKEATKNLREQELRRLINSNEIQKISQIKEALMKWGINMDDKMYICITADYVASEEDKSLTQFILENVCRETLESISHSIQFFFDEKGKMVFIVPGDEAMQLRMLAKKAAKKCYENLQHFLSIKCFFGIGLPIYLVDNIHWSYCQAKDALSYKIIDTDMCVAEYERVDQGIENVISLDWREVFGVLISYGVHETLSLIMQGTEGCKNLRDVKALERRQALMVQSFSSFFPEIAKNLSIPEFENCWSLMQWQKNIMEYLEKARRGCIDNRNTILPKNISLEVLNYIKEHALENLTLSSVAEHFKYNSSYISALLKKEFNKNFTSYIMELRIEQAKLLLDKTDMTIKEVAENVGYNDASYFSQVFKKETGISPQRYRNYVQI